MKKITIETASFPYTLEIWENTYKKTLQSFIDEGYSLVAIKFCHEDLNGMIFKDCIFDFCSFIHCNLNNVIFENCLFADCEFSIVTGIEPNTQFINCKKTSKMRRNYFEEIFETFPETSFSRSGDFKVVPQKSKARYIKNFWIDAQRYNSAQELYESQNFSGKCNWKNVNMEYAEKIFLAKKCLYKAFKTEKNRNNKYNPIPFPKEKKVKEMEIIRSKIGKFLDLIIDKQITIEEINGDCNEETFFEAWKILPASLRLSLTLKEIKTIKECNFYVPYKINPYI